MIAGSWLIASVYIDLTKQRSSAISRCGAAASLSQAPDWPCWANLKSEPASGIDACWADMPVSRWPPRTSGGELLAVLLVEQRLVVEQVLLGGAAGLEQIDDALCLGGECGVASGVRIRRGLAGRASDGERDAAEAGGRGAEEVAAGEAAEDGRWVVRHS